MDITLRRAHPLRGTLSVPPDKAICQRAALAAALADGVTEIRPWPDADDCERALDVARSLGVQVERGADGVRLVSSGRAGLRPPDAPLACGESGTTFRLAAGLLAGCPFPSVLSAGSSLSRRPMRRIVEPLARMGAAIDGRRAALGGEILPPLSIQGRRPLRAIRYAPPVPSAQVKSAILFAALVADGPTTVVEAAPTRDHTERLLRRCGVRVSGGPEVVLEPGAVQPPGRLCPPGDLSSAAFFIAATCCVPGSVLQLDDVGLNPTRTAFLAVLSRMGADLTMSASDDGWEPRGTITVRARPLSAVVIEPAEVPGLIDELPVLMAVAACARGTTRLTGLAELRVKETDRIRSMADGLAALGIRVRQPAQDAMEIDGGALAGGRVQSAGDHRTAMSLAVAGLLAERPTTVAGAECVAKSYPGFFDQLGALTGSTTGKTVDKG